MGRAAPIYWAVMLCILSQVIKLCRWLYFSRLKSFILSDISTLLLCSSSWVSKLLKTCSACVFIFLVAILFVYSTLWGIWLISVLFGEHLCVIRGTPPRPSAGVVLGLRVQQLRSFLKACRESCGEPLHRTLQHLWAVATGTKSRHGHSRITHMQLNLPNKFTKQIYNEIIFKIPKHRATSPVFDHSIL